MTCTQNGRFGHPYTKSPDSAREMLAEMLGEHRKERVGEHRFGINRAQQGQRSSASDKEGV
jgi:hypothetical protein